MEFDLLLELLAQVVKLRPPALHLGRTGAVLLRNDDTWLIKIVSSDAVTLRNTRTNVSVVLASRQIREYFAESPATPVGFLKLHCQIILSDKEPHFEPIYAV